MKTKFEEMMDRLPSNIKESDVLRLESKKVLAALLDLMLHSEARKSKVIYVNNGTLRKIAGINSNSLLEATRQLEDYDLITRKAGTVREVGSKKGTASEYTIKFNNLKKPLKELSFDDLFSEFIEEDESSGTPINTTITNTITTTNTISTTMSNTISTTNTTSNSNTISNSKSNTISNSNTIDNIFNNIIIEENNMKKENNFINKILDKDKTVEGLTREEQLKFNENYNLFKSEIDKNTRTVEEVINLIPTMDENHGTTQKVKEALKKEFIKLQEDLEYEASFPSSGNDAYIFNY